MTEARAILAGAYRLLDTATIADAVDAAFTPSGPSREELARRIRDRRGLVTTEGR